jgi:hypothetical protein
MTESKKIDSAESFLLMLESMFSNCILLYFLKETDWDFFLKAATFIGLQFPIFIFWAIIHIIVKEVFFKLEGK